MTEDLAAADARIADWVKRMKDAQAGKRDADGHADSESLARAADLESIYERRDWVKEIPPPPKKVGRGHRRLAADSREQFAKWVKQRYEWGSRQRLVQLHEAHAFISRNAVASNRPTGENALRPLWKLRDQGYSEFIDRVWNDAVKLACGLPVTAAETRKAVSAFLEAHKPEFAKNVAADDRTVAEIRAAKRARLIAEFDEILAEENATAKSVLNEMIRHFNEHQPELRAS